MEIKTLALLATVLLASTQLQSSNTSAYVDYQAKFGKSYENVEGAFRQAVYHSNVADIEAHNADSTQTYKRGINQFTDMTEEEFQTIMLAPRESNQVVDETVSESVGDVNWVTQGGVTRVKDQGNCGSCWAFSAAAQVESEKWVQQGTLGLFSEQQLCDCDTQINSGCNGGFEYYGIDYYAKNGICTEASYPYQSGGGSAYSCRQNSCTKDSFTIRGYNLFSGVSQLQTACNSRPIAVAVDAGRWSSYSSGIFGNCGTALNHAVLLAGYTSSYWLIKNSWGSFWGESGYIRLTGSANTCGVAAEPSYATV